MLSIKPEASLTIQNLIFELWTNLRIEQRILELVDDQREANMKGKAFKEGQKEAKTGKSGSKKHEKKEGKFFEKKEKQGKKKPAKAKAKAGY